ncbi:MAG TPA: helix-turn-helix domain-containing protein [Methanospirillum sp.]|nr:helix-turn-helix domain-containing protein [Methanospirillum sp.]
MVPGNQYYLSDKDEEISEILCNVGLKKNEARILVLMFKNIDYVSRDIERAADLRQPEVSVALNALIRKNWVEISHQNKQNKGRPVKIYRLSRTIDEILDELRETITGGYLKQVEFIEKVRILVKEARIAE